MRKGLLSVLTLCGILLSTGCMSREEKAQVASSVSQGMSELYGVDFNVYNVRYSGGTDFTIYVDVKLKEDPYNFEYTYYGEPKDDLGYARYGAARAYMLINREPYHCSNGFDITLVNTSGQFDAIVANKSYRDAIINNEVTIQDALSAVQPYLPEEQAWGYYSFSCERDEIPTVQQLQSTVQEFISYAASLGLPVEDVSFEWHVLVNGGTDCEIDFKFAPEDNQMELYFTTHPTLLQFYTHEYATDWDYLDPAAFDEVEAFLNDVQYYLDSGEARRIPDYVLNSGSSSEADAVESSVTSSADDGVSGVEDSSSTDIEGSSMPIFEPSTSEGAGSADEEELIFHELDYDTNEKAKEVEVCLISHGYSCERMLYSIRFSCTDAQYQDILALLTSAGLAP